MFANSSLVAQLLQLVPLPTFRRIVREEGGERYAQGFTCRMQLVATRYLQLALAKSLAEICDGLRLTCGKLNHLGITQAPAKSSLAYANEHRSAKIFFRAIKQCLRIKTFVGTRANALAVQMWTAPLAVLLVAVCRFRSPSGWHLSCLIALLRVNLLTYRDLWDWLNDPVHHPPVSPPEQLQIAF